MRRPEEDVEGWRGGGGGIVVFGVRGEERRGRQTLQRNLAALSVDRDGVGTLNVRSYLSKVRLPQVRSKRSSHAHTPPCTVYVRSSRHD